MRPLCVILIIAGALGCEAFNVGNPDPPRDLHNPLVIADPPPHDAVVHAAPTTPGPLECYAICMFDMLTQPRSEKHAIDQMFDYTEDGGVFGPDPKVLALNGLKAARLDLRFREPFGKALDVVRRESKQKTIVRLPEGRSQTFDVGDTFKDVSLFVWTAGDAVLGRHFTQARYSLVLTLEKVQPGGIVEYGLSWQANVGAQFQRTVSIPSLDMHVQLEKGQSLLIAPTGLAGRSVDRALLSGLNEETIRLTCLIITPTEMRARPVPKDAPAAGAADERTAK